MVKRIKIISYIIYGSDFIRPISFINVRTEVQLMEWCVFVSFSWIDRLWIIYLEFGSYIRWRGGTKRERKLEQKKGGKGMINIKWRQYFDLTFKNWFHYLVLFRLICLWVSSNKNTSPNCESMFLFFNGRQKIKFISINYFLKSLMIDVSIMYVL